MLVIPTYARDLTSLFCRPLISLDLISLERRSTKRWRGCVGGAMYALGAPTAISAMERGRMHAPMSRPRRGVDIHRSMIQIKLRVWCMSWPVLLSALPAPDCLYFVSLFRVSQVLTFFFEEIFSTWQVLGRCTYRALQRVSPVHCRCLERLREKAGRAHLGFGTNHRRGASLHIEAQGSMLGWVGIRGTGRLTNLSRPYCCT